MQIEDAARLGLIESKDRQPTSAKASDFLEDALSGLAQRAALRDQPNGERSAARAAAIVTAWTGREFTEADVWRVLIAIKMSRSIQGRFHADDYTDLSGYAALLGEHHANH